MLSEDVRAELAGIDPRKACCRLAELSALVRTAGSVHFRGGGRIALHLELSSPAVARRAFALLRSYGVPGEIRTFRSQAFEHASRLAVPYGATLQVKDGDTVGHLYFEGDYGEDCAVLRVQVDGFPEPPSSPRGHSAETRRARAD